MSFGFRWRMVAAVAAALTVLGGAVTIAAVQARTPAASVAARQPGAPAGSRAASAAGTPGTAAAGATHNASAGTDPTPPPGGGAGAPVGPLPRQLFVPDVIAALPAGISAAQLARISVLPGVRATLALDGGRVDVGGRLATVIAADPQAFRAWTPPQTAADTGAWTVLTHGGLLARGTAATTGQASVTGRVRVTLPVWTARDLGVPGIDAVVDMQRSAQLGLAGGAAVLINAPGADLRALMPKVHAILGQRAQVLNLVPIVVYRQLPVTQVRYTGKPPASYLELYQESAALYCPGLSWTVLAAIGEIESGHGRNDGPSSAGALGPMQFLPSTWALYGIDGFSDTGKPDIMNPIDAVPSAAHLLCIDGATTGLPGLGAAIFDYNHATWYVDEVLQLAAEYAAAYP